MLPGIFVQSAEHFGIHASYAIRSAAESLPVGVLAQGQQDLADRVADSRLVHTGRRLAPRLVDFAGQTAGDALGCVGTG